MSGNEIAEIVNVVNFYAVAVDSHAWELFDRIFTEDVEADFGGAAVWQGLGPLKDAFAAIHASFASTQHATRGHHVAIDGDRATCLSYVHANFIRDVPEGGNRYEAIGWYDDALRRTPAGWRIARRISRTQWSGGNPAVLESAPGDHAPDSLRAEAHRGTVGHLAALTRR
jgi:hypothetical protein